MICKKCLEDKDIYFFDKVSKNGYRKTCRKCRNEINYKNWAYKNYEKRKEYNKVYMKEHRTKEYFKNYQLCLDDIRKKIKTIDFRNYLESLFTENMNWDNYGTFWEIDHIESAIKLSKEGYDIEYINRLNNLQPMKISDNRCKCKENRI